MESSKIILQGTWIKGYQGPFTKKEAEKILEQLKATGKFEDGIEIRERLKKGEFDIYYCNGEKKRLCK